jgi:isopentenyl-diphosphate delta-isomerase
VLTVLAVPDPGQDRDGWTIVPQTNREGELVVLVDDAGRQLGTADKSTVHGPRTPLHLGFSCYVLDPAGEVLLTRRAWDKRTFGGVWTNSFCGHPAPGEPLVDAVCRRAAAELGLRLLPDEVELVLPDFRYRAEMSGVVENELCPVVVARTDGRPELRPDRGEVSDAEWAPWARFAADVLDGRRSVSPWCAEQAPLLVGLGPDPLSWPVGAGDRLPRALRERA